MGEAGRQLDLFRVYGSKIKCVILLVVTHATDMYSFGVVMADVLLSKRLDARDMPQGVTNGADAKQNMSTEQRDIIVSLLREPEYKGNSPQPSASELLRLLFLSSGPATFRRCVTFCEAISRNGMPHNGKHDAGNPAPRLSHSALRHLKNGVRKRLRTLSDHDRKMREALTVADSLVKEPAHDRLPAKKPVAARKVQRVQFNQEPCTPRSEATMFGLKRERTSAQGTCQDQTSSTLSWSGGRGQSHRHRTRDPSRMARASAVLLSSSLDLVDQILIHVAGLLDECENHRGTMNQSDSKGSDAESRRTSNGNVNGDDWHSDAQWRGSGRVHARRSDRPDRRRKRGEDY